MKVYTSSNLLRFAAVLTCVAFLACGDDGDGGGSGDSAGNGTGGTSAGDGAGGSSAGSGSGSSGGSNVGDSNCTATTGDAVVLAPQNLSDSSVIYRMEADDSHLYFSTINRLFRVPLGGGAAEELFYDDLAIVVYFWVRADDIVVMDGRKVLSLPKIGGEPTELASLEDSPDASLDGRIDAMLRGNTLYAKSRRGFDEDLEVTFFATNLDSGESRVLYSGTEGENSTIAVTDEHVYFVDTDPSMAPPGDELPIGVPDLLYRVPLSGGAPEQVDIGDAPLQLAIVGSDEQSVYLNTAVPMSVLDAGIGRISFDGGAPERVLDGSFLFGSVIEHIAVEGTGYLRALDKIYELPLTGPTRSLGCVVDDAHSMAVTNDSIFVAVFQEGGESAIVRLSR